MYTSIIYTEYMSNFILDENLFIFESNLFIQTFNVYLVSCKIKVV